MYLDSLIASLTKQPVKYSLCIFRPPRTEEWARDYIHNLNLNEETWDQVIVHEGANIGFCGLCNISLQNHSAEFYILIGDSNHWGKGVGTEADRIVLEYGFKKLNLHRIWLTVSEENISAVKSYKKLGYTSEWIMRDATFTKDKHQNKIVMSILSREMHS